MATFLDPGYRPGTHRLTLPVGSRPQTVHSIVGAAVSGILSTADLVDLYHEIGDVLADQAPVPEPVDVASYHAAMQRLRAVRDAAVTS